MSPRTAAASIAALRMEKLHKSARNSRANHFVLRCPAPGARSFAPPGAVWFCPGAKVFALPGAVCCWPGAVPVPTCPGAVLDFPFVCAITGKLNRATKSTKAAMRIMICSMHVGLATIAKSPPRTRRVWGISPSHCLSLCFKYSPATHGLHTELRLMCN